MNPKFLNKIHGEKLSKITNIALTSLQNDMNCDQCEKFIRAGTRVLGKIAEFRKVSTGIHSSRFYPTCLECVDMN